MFDVQSIRSSEPAAELPNTPAVARIPSSHLQPSSQSQATFLVVRNRTFLPLHNRSSSLQAIGPQDRGKFGVASGIVGVYVGRGEAGEELSPMEGSGEVFENITVRFQLNTTVSKPVPNVPCACTHLSVGLQQSNVCVLGCQRSGP